MKKIIFILFCVCLVNESLQAQLSVDTNTSGDQMSNIINGSGVMIQSAVLDCPNGSYGVFYGQNSNLGLDYGILLTTGNALDAIGPNTTTNATGDISGNPGDSLLDALPSTQSTSDACAITLNLSSTCADTIQLNYIFASDEYLEYINGFHDAVGIFVSGPGIAGIQNIALVPGTTTPVGLESINNLTNPAYYVDNGNGGPPQNTDPMAIQYDGYTTVLTASFPVIPFDVYEVKIVVADDVDTAIDSGIFIEAGSLISLDSNSGIIADAGADQIVCIGDEVTLDASSSFNVDTYTWSGSTAITDVNAESTTMTASETTMIYLHTIDASGCEDEDSLLIEVLDLPLADAGEDILTCEIYNGPIGPADPDLSLDYEWTSSDGTIVSTDPNPTVLLESIDGALVIETYTLTVTAGASCTHSDEIDVILEGVSSINAGLNDTIFQGDAAVLSATGAGANGLYLWSPAEIVSQQNGQTISVAPNETTDFYVNAISETGCEGTDTVTVVVLVRPTVHVPSAFSPNSDSNNDMFGINFVQVDQLLDFKVFNRYGQMVYNGGTDMNARWDGTFRGNPQPIGVYSYVVRFLPIDSDESIVQMGNVTLIR